MFIWDLKVRGLSQIKLLWKKYLIFIQLSTPIHCDVFGSFSWSANICGKKKWLVIPPNKIEKLKSLFNGNVPNDLYSSPEYQNILKQVDAFEIIQNSGEVLFVPSGYMHQVINLEDTISINHNWFNSCNLKNIYLNLLQANSEVQNQIIDLKYSFTNEEWINNCSKIMVIHFGMNFRYFVDLLLHITKRLKREAQKRNFHFLHDIGKIKEIVCEMCINTEFDSFKMENKLLSSLIDDIMNVD